MSDHAHILDAATVREFIFAGHATFTLKSQRSGDHYTFRMSRADGKPLWFLSLLTAPGVFTYVGVVEDNALRLTRKSRYTPEAVPVQAFSYFLGHLMRRGAIAPHLEVWHEGACGRCGRPLTHPESIARGIGPDCWEMIAA